MHLDEQPLAVLTLDTIMLDTTGLICPEPIMLLHQTIRKMVTGQRAVVVATDPSTLRDIPKFCMHLGHHLDSQQQEEQGESILYRYEIVKG